jgi:phage terminase small subunit
MPRRANGDHQAALNPESVKKRREKFAKELIKNGGNRTQAAIAAGYSPHSASEQGSRVFGTIEVQEALQRHRSLLEEAGSSPLELVKELLNVARVDPADLCDDEGNLLPLKQIPPEVRRAISSFDVDELWEGRGDDRRQAGVTKKIRFWDKLASIEKLARIANLFEKDNNSSRPNMSLQIMVVAPDKSETVAAQRVVVEDTRTAEQRWIDESESRRG